MDTPKNNAKFLLRVSDELKVKGNAEAAATLTECATQLIVLDLVHDKLLAVGQDDILTDALHSMTMPAAAFRGNPSRN